MITLNAEHIESWTWSKVEGPLEVWVDEHFEPDQARELKSLLRPGSEIHLGYANTPGPSTSWLLIHDPEINLVTGYFVEDGNIETHWPEGRPLQDYMTVIALAGATEWDGEGEFWFDLFAKLDNEIKPKTGDPTPWLKFTK